MKLIRVSTFCMALLFLSFFHLSLSGSSSNTSLTDLIKVENNICQIETTEEGCKNASKGLGSKNYTNCCFVKPSNNSETPGNTSGSNLSSRRVLTENTKTDNECVRLFKVSVYIQKKKEEEKYKAYDKVEIKCFSSSAILKQGLIIGIALVLLI